MAAVLETVAEQPIFENVGQAVHVAFLVMAQEAIQDAPLRMALIRIMESIKLENGNQRNWLDQLRGTHSGSVNFGGLSSGEVRAQCAMITQAVRTNLPLNERWVIQAKYGQTDFVDEAALAGGTSVVESDLQAARIKVRDLLTERASANAELYNASAAHRAVPSESARARWAAARGALDELNAALVAAERVEQQARVAVDRVTASGVIDNGRHSAVGGTVRRFAFSPERIEAIKGLSDWFAPMFPRVSPLAIDCMLGRMFANHKKIEISARDIAERFGGSHMKYLRASCKMKNHVRQLEENAMARLGPLFAEQGVSFLD